MGDIKQVIKKVTLPKDQIVLPVGSLKCLKNEKFSCNINLLYLIYKYA